MIKILPNILILVITLISITFFGFSCSKQKAVSPSPTPTLSPSTATSSEEEAIRTFFAKINDEEVEAALVMMTDEMIGGQRQSWASNFESIDSILVKSIEPEEPAGWHDDEHFYKVALEVEVKDGAPQYGWANGEDIRWIKIKKVDGSWKIQEIATGP